MARTATVFQKAVAGIRTAAPALPRRLRIFAVGRRRWPRGLASFATRRAAHLVLGRRGERAAAELLEERGLDVLVRNYRTPNGEVDIVARDKDVLCFVEVKTRRSSRRARPGEAVTPEKQARIIRAAHQYLREIGRPQIVHRYDVVEILLRRQRFVASARHHPGAFLEPDRLGRRVSD